MAKIYLQYPRDMNYQYMGNNPSGDWIQNIKNGANSYYNDFVTVNVKSIVDNVRNLKNKSENQDISNTTLDTIFFTPKTWGVVSAVQDVKTGADSVLGNILDDGGAVARGKAAVKSAGDTLDSIVSIVASQAGSGYNQTEFFKTVNKNDAVVGGLMIGLPLKPEFMNMQVAHEWGMENEVMDINYKRVAQGLQQTATSDGLDSLISNVFGNIKDIVGGVASKVFSSVMNTSLSQAGGSVYQAQRQTYKGSTPLQLKFNWTFVPKSPDEAKEIAKIIKSFEFLSTPQALVDNSSNYISTQLRRNPVIWKIEFPKTDKSANLMNKANTFWMICTGHTSSLGESDFMMTYPDGFPNQIKFEIEFTEFFSLYSAQDRYGFSNIQEILEDPFRYKAGTI